MLGWLQRNWWIAGLVPALIAVAIRWGASPGIMMEDYAQYTLHARAIVEGRPYSDTGYLFTQFRPFLGPAAMPPGLPVLLAAGFLVGLDNATGTALLMLAVAIGFGLAASWYFARRDGPLTGALVGGLLFLGPEIVAFATHVQTDLLLCLLVWLVIVLQDSGRVTTWRLAAVTILGLYAMSVRIIGVTLVPAALLFWLMRRRELGDRLVIPPLVWIASGLLGALVLGGSVSVVRSISWLTFANTRYHLLNAKTYGIAVFQFLMYPFPSNTANDLYHLVAVALMAVGLVTWWRGGGRDSFLACFAVLYPLPLLALPFSESRYLWPLYPLFAFFLVRGLLVSLGAVARRAPRSVPLVAAVALIALLILSGLLRLSRAPVEPLFAERDETRDLVRWIRQAPEHDSMRVAFVRPRMLALEAGVRSMSTFAGPVARLERELRRRCITHLVAGSLGLHDRIDLAVRVLLLRSPGLFSEVYANRGFVVYRLTVPCGTVSSIFDGPSGPEVAESRLSSERQPSPV